MIKAAVIGHPIGHSKSPLIHNYWIAKYGLSGSYEAIDIPCEALEEKVRRLVEAGYAGFNVTIPHKEEIAGICDELSDTARQVGAVNTVRIVGGKLLGDNTDVFGFTENIKEGAPEFVFSRAAAVLLGAGGASRAIVHGLLEHGTPEVIICNRTRAKAEEVKASCVDPARVRIEPWEARNSVLARAGLLVNTTALGMQGQAPLEIDLSALSQDTVVSDVVYTPLETELLKAAAVRGNKTVTGIGMLLQQARPAFEAWFGVMPEVTAELRGKVLGIKNWQERVTANERE